MLITTTAIIVLKQKFIFLEIIEAKDGVSIRTNRVALRAVHERYMLKYETY